MAKKKVKSARRKPAVAKQRSVKHEVVVRVAQPEMLPTTTDLAEPIRDGKSLTIPKTWLSEKQITRLVEKTPPQYVYQRPAKGGGKWEYVTVSYVQRVLDYAFGFNWDFEIVEHGKEADHVWVLGKLVVRNPQGTMTITKTQFGRSEVKHKRGDQGMLDYGNDLKAAASDALKKCASMLGIARDIYGKTDYKAESGNEPRESTAQISAPAAEETSQAQIECHGINYREGCPVEGMLSEPEANYSKQVYGKVLCRHCQKSAKPVRK